MEKERKLAKLEGYPDPINDCYDKTGEMYNRVVDFLLDEAGSKSPHLYVVVATHNEGKAIEIHTLYIMVPNINFYHQRNPFGV